MNKDDKCIGTWNIKKCKRHEAKKRKLEALLNLLDDNVTPVNGKKKKESLSESYKQLKDQLKGYQKKPDEEPAFYLTPTGSKAEINLISVPDENSQKEIKPIFTEDVYQFLLRSVIGHMSPYPLKWGTLEKPNNIKKCVIIVVEGIAVKEFLENITNEHNFPKIFSNVVQIVSSNVHFASEIGTFHKMTDFIDCKNAFFTTFPVVNDDISDLNAIHIVEGQNKEQPVEEKIGFSINPVDGICIEKRIDENCYAELPIDVKQVSRLHLLLSPIQMAMENYPLPQNVFEYSKTNDYIFSKDMYTHVTGESPIFSIDCEMCQTSNNPSELTRIAVVNENLETIYHTLVKPTNKITNYLTRFSGITPEMLEGVTVTLSDVQQELQKLLPSDAILCGHSLNSDLHALQMMHPYVIDTSVIFNSSGIRHKKDSLKYLTRILLRECIQGGRSGHNPVEDAVATMKLVNLKLSEELRFGDACLNDLTCNLNNNSDSKSFSVFPSQSLTAPVVSATLQQTVYDGFFKSLKRFKKKACLVGTNETLKHYDTSILNDDVQKFVKSTDSKVLKKTLKQIEHFDFISSHVNVNDLSVIEALQFLDNLVEKLFNACPQRTSFSMLISGVDEKNFEDFKRGLYFVKLKK